MANPANLANNFNGDCDCFKVCQHTVLSGEIKAFFTPPPGPPCRPLDGFFFGNCRLLTFTDNPWFRFTYFTEVLNKQFPSSVDLVHFMDFFNANLGKAYPEVPPLENVAGINA